MVADSKKIREKTLESYRKKAQEKKYLAEKVEKRVSTIDYSTTTITSLHTILNLL